MPSDDDDNADADVASASAADDDEDKDNCDDISDGLTSSTAFCLCPHDDDDDQ